MLNTSARWKEAQLAVPRPTPQIRVSMYVIDPATVGDAKVEVFDPYMFFSNPQQIMTLEEVEQNYATCEQDFWKLDGSMRLLPSQGPYEEAGLVYEELTNEDGYLSIVPKIIITFKQYFDAIGLTLNFDYLNNGYATSFRARAYSDNTLLLDEVVNATGPRNEVSIYVDEFNKVEFDLYHFNRPNYRPRVFDVLTGLIKVWDNTNLISATYTNEIAMLSDVISGETLDITVDNSSLAFDPENLKQDSWRYFLEDQPVLVEYGFKYSETTSEYIRKAYLYLSKWTNEERTADFSATHQFYFMTDKYYKGTFVNRSLYDLAQDVFLDLDLPLNSDTTYKWRIDDSLKNLYCNMPLPVDTHANILKLIAQAGGCIMYQNERANIFIQKRNTSQSGYLERRDKSVSYTTIEFDKTVKNVLVDVYSYTFDENTSVLFEANVELDSDGYGRIEYPTARNITVTVLSGTRTSQTIYAGSAEFTFSTPSATVRVTGQKMNTATTTRTIRYNNFGEDAEINNILITNSTVAEVSGRFVGDYLEYRRLYSRSDKGAPELVAGDVIMSQNKFTGDEGRPTIVTKQILYTQGGTTGELEEREVQ